MGFSVEVRVNKIPQVMGSVVDNTESSVRDSANFMRDYARGIAPVLTGAFKASLYVNGPNSESDYVECAANAQELNGRPEQIVREIQAASLDLGVQRLRNPENGRFSLPQAIVAPAVEYGLYLEEGTYKMAPRPTLRPAALATEEDFKNRMSGIVDGY